MPNDYFEFQEFIVYQNLAAMKVGTDAVLLGAWANVSDASNALDIGSGTGVVALMAAQRNAALFVDAIDIDEDAYMQSRKNFEISKWNSRLQAKHSSLQDYANNYTGSLYDCIFCNPPFFTAGKKSAALQKSTARHDHLLSFEALLSGVARLLSARGSCSVVIPIKREDAFIQTAGLFDLYPARYLRVKPTPNKDASRVLIEIQRSVTRLPYDEEMILEEFGRHGFSEKYKKLMRDFQKEEYLK